jgi:hypothetical protein
MVTVRSPVILSVAKNLSYGTRRSNIPVAIYRGQETAPTGH